MSDTDPMPSHRGHMPPMRSKDTALRGPLPTFDTPLACTLATLNENALEEPMCGTPSLLNRILSIALASVAVPTVDRALAPIRCWSMMIAVVRPSSTSTSGRARLGMKPCRNAL